MNKKFDNQDLAVIALAKTSLILSEEKFGEAKNNKIAFSSFADSLVQLKDGIDWIFAVLKVYNFADFAFDEIRKYSAKDKAINLKLYECFLEVLSVQQNKELFEHNKEAVQEKLLNQKVDITNNVEHIIKDFKDIRKANSSKNENSKQGAKLQYKKNSLPLLETKALGTLGLAKATLIRGLQEENTANFINLFVEGIATIIVGYPEYPAQNVVKACRFFFEDESKEKNDLLIKSVMETCKEVNVTDDEEENNKMSNTTIEFVITYLTEKNTPVLKEFDDITQKYLGGLTNERWTN